MTNFKAKYEQNGYFIAKKIINKKQIISLKKFISTLDPKLFVPFSNEAWGYGNCINLDEFKVIMENKVLLHTVKEILGNNYEFNHLMVNRKPPWIGPEVEYHQEVFNSKTFAPGASYDQIKRNWCQIYLPLESETPNNGGLRILSNSHLLGILDSEDIVNQNYSHKRRVPVSTLNKVVKLDGCELVDLNLRAGDCLFFSPLLVHGSPSNGTAKDRISLVLQSKKSGFERNNEIFEKETSHRTSFIINSLMNKMYELDNNTENKYSDFISKR
jgi:ectoine hydroxylase-related dioxygenase (phytanoyl-CoA dioxygenase family)